MEKGISYMGIAIKGVSKSVDGLLVLNDIDLHFKGKTIYGLLGQNDSGKTTLMRLMTQLRYPSEGVIEIDGVDIFDNPKVLEQLYYQSKDPIYGKRTKLDSIVKWMSEAYSTFQLDVCQQLMSKYHLSDTDRFGQLSLKKQMLFRSCLAFSVDVDYLLLDEPVYTLDAYHRNELYEDLQASYKRYPKTIILSTHVIDEIEDMIEKVVMLEDGQVLVEGSVKKLVATAFSVEGPEKDVREFLQGKRMLGQEYFDGKIKAYFLESEPLVTEDLEISIEALNLQNMFIQLTKDIYRKKEISNESKIID